MHGLLITLILLGPVGLSDQGAAGGSTEEPPHRVLPCQDPGGTTRKADPKTPVEESVVQPNGETKPGTEEVQAPERKVYKTSEALVKAVLIALEKRDEKALHALRIDKKTYCEKLWPEMMKGQPKNTTTADFHWMLLGMTSAGGVRDVLRDHGGHAMQLVSIQPEQIVDYEGFKLWKRVKVTFSLPDPLPDDQLHRKEVTDRLFGSLIEHDGEFHILGFPN